MKLKIFAATVLFMCALPATVLAHGEDKPGPHGGVIRMPGAFHTEVLKLTEDSIAIYLLDISFKEPVVADSTLKATIKNGDKISELSCSPKGERFECALPRGASLTQGVLAIKARRKTSEGITVDYGLPLGTDTEEEMHSHH